MDKVRLIDATTLSAAISAAQNSLKSSDDEQWSCDKKYYKGLAWAQRLIRQAPTIAKLTAFELAGLRAMIYRHELTTADVAPVRHGRWTPADRIGDCCCTCSECGFVRDAYLLAVGNYCPNCGARMDGKEGNT